MIFFYSLLHCQLFGWRCEITTWGSQTFTYLAHFSLCIQMSGIDWMFLCPFETWSDPMRGNCMPSQTPENFYSISPHRSRDSNWNWKEQQLFRCEFTFFASIKIYFLSLCYTHSIQSRELSATTLETFTLFELWSCDSIIFLIRTSLRWCSRMECLLSTHRKFARLLFVTILLFFYYFSFLLLRWWLRMRSWIDWERKFLRRAWQGWMKWATKMRRKWMIEGMTCWGGDWLR